MADEPTSALDPRTTQSILACLREINQRFGVTIVIVTHEMEVVRAICQRAAVVDNGKVIEIMRIVNGMVDAQSELAKSLLETT